MNPTLSFFIVAVAFSLVGGAVGWIISMFKYKDDARIKKIIKNPGLLARELKKHGKIIDIGTDGKKEEIQISAETNPHSKKEELVVKRVPIESQLPKLPKHPTHTSTRRGKKR